MKHTTGDTFQPDAGPVFFIASNPKAVEESNFNNVLVAVNELTTKKDDDRLARMLDAGRNVLIDSGIFNLAMAHARTHGLHMDDALLMPPSQVDGFSKLRDKYYEVADTYGSRVWGMIELDQGGRDVKPETRAQIEADTGITPIPVYHPLVDGWEYYDTIAEQYDRICFGNIVKASPPVRLRLVFTAFERAKKYPHLWTHLLGLFPNQNTLSMLGMKGSFDSSSWLTGVRWMPSWKDSAMLKMEGSFPPDLWYNKRSGTVEEMLSAIAEYTQRTVDAVREDTHP
jgi:hypothetical protein